MGEEVWKRTQHFILIIIIQSFLMTDHDISSISRLYAIPDQRKHKSYLASVRQGSIPALINYFLLRGLFILFHRMFLPLQLS